ncbi:MAG: hypothetical protein M5R36_14935 [Deltaproteobacteria bacterium]|nr:hypothetical protein [Deltaproteobacteria bacterium]
MRRVLDAAERARPPKHERFAIRFHGLAAEALTRAWRWSRRGPYPGAGPWVGVDDVFVSCVMEGFDPRTWPGAVSTDGFALLARPRTILDGINVSSDPSRFTAAFDPPCAGACLVFFSVDVVDVPGRDALQLGEEIALEEGGKPLGAAANCLFPETDFYHRQFALPYPHGRAPGVPLFLSVQGVDASKVSVRAYVFDRP